MKSTAVALATLALLAALAGCGASATPDASVTPRGTTSAGPHGKLCLSAGTPPRITWTTVPPRNADTPRPAQLDQGSFGDQFEQLHARSVDPAPVTIAQAFPRRPVLPSAGCGWPGIPSVSYATRKYAQAGRDCGAAVWGAALKRALMLAGCSQALRAAYRTNVGNYVGMMALLNLRDSVGATQVANLLAPDVLGTVTNPGVAHRPRQGLQRVAGLRRRALCARQVGGQGGRQAAVKRLLESPAVVVPAQPAAGVRRAGSPYPAGCRAHLREPGPSLAVRDAHGRSPLQFAEHRHHR
jgi:hypothetical protein